MAQQQFIVGERHKQLVEMGPAPITSAEWRWAQWDKLVYLSGVLFLWVYLKKFCGAQGWYRGVRAERNLLRAARAGLIVGSALGFAAGRLL